MVITSVSALHRSARLFICYNKKFTRSFDILHTTEQYSGELFTAELCAHAALTGVYLTQKHTHTHTHTLTKLLIKQI